MKKVYKLKIFVILTTFSLFACSQMMSSNVKLDETPANEKEWGFHPSEGSISDFNPPSFSWRPQKEIISWELECESNTESFKYVYNNIDMNVHCPSKIFPIGGYSWRYRGVDSSGGKTDWSITRKFNINNNAVKMPMPSKEELIARVPKTHPRLFMRPEQLEDLRKKSKGEFKSKYDDLVSKCEELLKNPPPTEEPKKFPDSMVRYGYDWVIQWWGNRVYVINALDAAATLAFTYQIGGNKDYAKLAKQILIDCAKWDPKGASGYRYNDEAGMPYMYYFSRAYTFSYDFLSDEERNICRNVAQIRGKEMYEHLYPRQLWDSYVSHNARAWHFLGEMSIAFLGEVEGAEDWLWFAMNITFNEYPIWADDDGGWHEGFSYWHSYLGRFKNWSFAIRSAMDINVYAKPYFANTAGYYAMYMMPPGRDAAEFGDASVRVKETNIVPLFGEGTFLRSQAVNAVPLMSRLAAESGNGYWQWYVNQMGGSVEETGYLGYLQPLPPKPKPIVPTDIPTSRLFEGIGIAALNSNLINAKDDVQILFKSSQMGTQSHGIESNNTFALWAYGERMLIRTGHYYMYGAPHHADWVWETKSQNNITVDGKGQLKHSPFSKGKITAFKTTPKIDYVVGEAGEAYRFEQDNVEQNLLNRYTRTILFIKPELMIVFDRLEAKEPSTFEYRLHALNKFELEDKENLMVQSGDVVCEIDMLTPINLTISQTDQYDPNPWEQIKNRDWHFTAATGTKSKNAEFVTLYRPHKKEQSVPNKAELNRVEGGYVLTTEVTEGKIVALLPLTDSTSISAEGLESNGEVVIQLSGINGEIIETVKVEKTLFDK
ncbi:MAG: DUF4962 domain-containing protein [Bacteroidetes bacterium]|nr:DUF4962 domain-containing protein [Bacteroidota bacterium]MBU1116519.1 DUF4962 domain-containing protein [Bacteroidota bacterium]MBU1798401.1 DUF4962 domain-containing protein [Bacteroidota bacterium]